MGLMELGCTRRGFGRDVQPAAPNRPRCWVLVGLMLGVRLVGAGGFCTAFCYGTGFGSGGEPVDGYSTLRSIEQTPSTWRRTRSFAEKGARETWHVKHQKRVLSGFV